MSSLLEKSLDDIIGSSSPRNQKRNNSNKRQSKRVNPNSRINKGYNKHKRPFKRSLQLPLQDPNSDNKEPYLRVSNLHPQLTEKDLKGLFETIGPIEKVNLQLNTHGESTGIAFIEFEDPNNVDIAIKKFDGRRAAGQIINVENAMPLINRISNNNTNSRFDKNKGKNKSNKKISKKSLEDLDNELNQYMGGKAEQTEHSQEHSQEEQIQNQVQNQTHDLAHNQVQAQVQDQVSANNNQEPFPPAENGEEMTLD